MLLSVLFFFIIIYTSEVMHFSRIKNFSSESGRVLGLGLLLGLGHSCHLLHGSKKRWITFCFYHKSTKRGRERGVIHNKLQTRNVIQCIDFVNVKCQVWSCHLLHGTKEGLTFSLP